MQHGTFLVQLVFANEKAWLLVNQSINFRLLDGKDTTTDTDAKVV